jgi:outer membrane biosynthesis protein TonB
MQAVHPGFTSQRQALQNADGLRRTMMMSLGVHVTVVAVLFVMPRSWFVKEKPQTIPVTLEMGSPGEKTGGLNPAGAQPIQEVAPPPKRPTPLPVVTPPKTETIAVPTKPPPKATPLPADKASDKTTPRPPTTGAAVTPGTAAAATGATGQSTGISVGGGAGGTTAVLDSNFCCMEYAKEVLRRIEVRWPKNQQEIGETTVMFEIRRDGSFSKPVVEKSSGSPMLDVASQSAFTDLRLPPLPEQYTGQTLKIHLVFPYKR